MCFLVPVFRGGFIVEPHKIVFGKLQSFMTVAAFNFSSKLVFGTWRLADKASNDPKDILIRIKSCIDMGITCFDLADIYGGYTYEELFGKALALEPSLRSKIQLVTKCNIQYPVGAGRPEVKVHHYDTSKEHIAWSVNRSLEKIGVEYLDVVLIHRPDPLMNATEMAQVFTELKNAGKVKHFGVSNFTPSQFDLVSSKLDFPLVTNQVEFSVLHLDPLFDGTFDQMQKLGVSPMIWSPLAGGKLFAPESEQDEKTKRVVKELCVIAKELGPLVTIDQVAYAFINKVPCNPVVVVGTNNVKRVKSVVESLNVVLDKTQWFRILVASQGHGIP